MTPQDASRDDEPLSILLRAAAEGSREAFDRAYAVLYRELSHLAHAQRFGWVGNDTLSTSVLVHETYLKLLGRDIDPQAGDLSRPRWEGRRHFFALAAQAMRQVLVNYAEQQQAAKRGGGATRVSLDSLNEGAGLDAELWPGARASAEERTDEHLLALDAALRRLQLLDPRQARIVECRFFAGLSIADTADVLNVSPATVKREWSAARRWLHADIATRGASPSPSTGELGE